MAYQNERTNGWNNTSDWLLQRPWKPGPIGYQLLLQYTTTDEMQQPSYRSIRFFWGMKQSWSPQEQGNPPMGQRDSDLEQWSRKDWRPLMWSITWQKLGLQSCPSIDLGTTYGSRRRTLNSDIRKQNSPLNDMDPSRSSKRFPLLPTKFNCPCHGAYTMCSTPPSFPHIKRPQHTDLTSPGHHLI